MNKQHFIITLILAMLLGWFGTAFFYDQQLFLLQLLGMALIIYVIRVANFFQLLALVSSYGLLTQWQSLMWLFAFNEQFSNNPDEVIEPFSFIYTLIIVQQFLLAYLLPACLCYWLFNKRLAGFLWGLPIIFTLCEAFRARALTGFTLGQPGYGLIDSVWASVLPLSGILGLTFVAWLLVSIVMCLYFDKQKLTRLLWPLGLLLGLPATQWLDWLTPLSTVPIRVVHDGADINMKNNAIGRWQRQHQLQSLSKSPTAKLVLWPEGSVSPGLGLFGVIKDFASTLRHQEVELLFGAYNQQGDNEYNAIVRGHDLYSVYQKYHLIPFGEYLPNHVPDFVAPKALDTLQHTQLTAGPAQQPDIDYVDTKLRPMICFEVMFGHDFVKGQEDFGAFVYFNDLSWVRHTLMLQQSLIMARTRAMEFAKPLVAVSNQGISGYITGDGQVRHLEYGLAPVALDVVLTPNTGLTWYARWGDAPFLTAMLVYFLYVLGRRVYAFVPKAS